MTKAIQTEPGQARSCQSGRPIQPSSAHAKHTATQSARQPKLSQATPAQRRAGQARPPQPGQERERERKTEKERERDRKRERPRKKEKERERERKRGRERTTEKESQDRGATKPRHSFNVHMLSVLCSNDQGNPN